jgi:hypothetical protein
MSIPCSKKKICVDYQNGVCKKTVKECQFAHPPPNCPLDNDNNLVIVCVDFIKGKCNRETCKYFHPPEHLVSHLKKLKLSNNAAAAAAAANTSLINPSLLNLSLFPTSLQSQFTQTQFINPIHLLNSISNFNTLQQPHLTTTYQHNPNQARYYNFNSNNNYLKHYGKNIHLSPYTLNNKSATNHSTINQNLQIAIQQQQQINDLINRNNLNNNSNNNIALASSSSTTTTNTTSPNANILSNQVIQSTPNATSTSSNNNATNNSNNSSQKIANLNNAQLTAAFANASTTAGQNLVGVFVIS